MKLYEGTAFVALIMGMGLAFFLNYADTPIWISLFTGIILGLVSYFTLIWLKQRGTHQ